MRKKFGCLAFCLLTLVVAGPAQDGKSKDEHRTVMQVLDR
jgi:hypothetical protein